MFPLWYTHRQRASEVGVIYNLFTLFEAINPIYVWVNYYCSCSKPTAPAAPCRKSSLIAISIFSSWLAGWECKAVLCRLQLEINAGRWIFTRIWISFPNPSAVGTLNKMLSWHETIFALCSDSQPAQNEKFTIEIKKLLIKDWIMDYCVMPWLKSTKRSARIEWHKHFFITSEFMRITLPHMFLNYIFTAPRELTPPRRRLALW